MEQEKPDQINTVPEKKSVKIQHVSFGLDFVKLTIKINQRIYSKLLSFINKHGGSYFNQDRVIIASIIDYGLTEVSISSLQKNMTSMKGQMSEYAASRFQCHDYYVQNNAMTAGLKYYLAKNRYLKTQIKLKGLESELEENEWDDWDEKMIDSFYHRYIK